MNFVASGHLLIVSAVRKTPLCVFRTTGTTTGRQNHMSLFSQDGKYILVSNQNGRIFERVRVLPNHAGFVFEASASLDMVGGNRILAQPIAFDPNPVDGVSCTVEGVVPNNQPLTTPLGTVKQGAGIRPTNNVICAIPARNNRHVFATLGGGGLFAVDYTVTPMQIVAEWDTSRVRSAGCGGVQDGSYFYTNSGTSGPGISEFSVYRVPIDTLPLAPAFAPAPNTPAILATFADPLNGQTVTSAQQRDAHGLALVNSGGVSYIHQADRVQGLD